MTRALKFLHVSPAAFDEHIKSGDAVSSSGDTLEQQHYTTIIPNRKSATLTSIRRGIVRLYHAQFVSERHRCSRLNSSRQYRSITQQQRRSKDYCAIL